MKQQDPACATPVVEDEFDALLRHQLRSDYLDDQGFTAQVMAALPAQQPLKPWLEKLILAVPVLLIGLLVCWQLPWRAWLQAGYGWLLLLDTASLIGMGVALFVCLLVAPLLWLFTDEA